MSRSAKLNMSRGAVLSMVRLASGIIRVKVVALALGVGGVGIFALAQQVSITAVSLVGLGLATPIINLGRPSVARARYSDAGEVAGSALAILALNITILILVGLIAGPGLMQSYGQSDQWLLWALVAAIILGAAASTFWEGMSFLSDRFDIYTKAGIASALADLVFIASGAWAYGLRGAVLALPMGPLVLFAAYALLLRRDPIAREVLGRLSFSLARLRPLLTYSAMMFGAGAVTSIGLTAARAEVVTTAGAAANGYLQAITSLSGYLLSFLTTGFYGHLYARAAAEGDTPQVRAELKSVLRLGLLISFTGCGAAIALAGYLIPLFYSGQFRPAIGLMIAYMPGEYCYQALILLVGYQLTVGRRRRYLGWNLGYIGVLFTIAMAAIPSAGPWAYVGAHVVASIAMLGVAAFTCRRTGQIDRSLMRLILGLLATLAAVSAVLSFGDSHGLARSTALLGLVPFAISGLILARDLSGALWRHDVRPAR